MVVGNNKSNYSERLHCKTEYGRVNRQTYQIFQPSEVEISQVTVLPNGQIVNAIRTDALSTVERRNSDGSLDAAFHTGTGSNGRINMLYCQTIE